MARKSLSASMGSWYIHLIYRPRKSVGGPATPPVPRESTALLYLPAYIALAVGMGAGCQALAHFITLGQLTGYLLFALLTAVAISYGARCASGNWARFCAAMRWPFVLLILFLAVSARSNSLLPPESEGEGNSVVAVMVGLTTIISVAVVGARSGGRMVPLSAPLVPGLSLFGLLCLVSVDTIVQICFLIFVACSLYLLAYERFLRRYVRENDPGPTKAKPTGSALTLLRPLPTYNSIVRWAAGSLLVCSVWFGLFMLGGALFYYPVQSILPRLLAPQLSRVRAAAQGSMLDFRGSSSVMELRGGNYVLSDREMLRITVHQGEPTGLWRGRIYENYNRSRWQEGDSLVSTLTDPRQSLWFHTQDMSPRETPPPPIDSKLGSYREVMEFVEPMDGAVASVYSSGLVEKMHPRPDFSTEDNVFDPLHARPPYLVRSAVVEPKPRALSTAPGFSHQQANEIRQSGPVLTRLKLPSDLTVTLQPPTDGSTARTISAIAQQIRLGSRTKLKTPYDKVRAISEYLIQNCNYSLHAPTVPVSQDAVVFFLTQSRAGACDMFASSMALLLREMDVPARVVTGYIQPETTPQNLKGTRDRPTWIVRERDAHAWVEYYITGLGWLSFDPTVGTRTANESIPGQIAELLALPTISLPPRLLILPGSGFLLIIIGLVWTVYDRRAAETAPATPEELERRRISAAYYSAVGQLRRRVPRLPNQTAQEYEAKVSRSSLPLSAKQEFAALTHLYTAAHYEAHPPKVKQADLNACLHRFQRGLRDRTH